MKQSVLISFAIQFLSFAMPAGSSLGQAIMNIRLRDLDGNQVSIGQLKGEQLTVLDFWATWCKPCVKSIPRITELSRAYDEKIVRFLGVNEDSPRNQGKVRPFAQSVGIQYTVLMDPDQEVMTELLVAAFPTLIILNANGKILYTHEGYTPGDEQTIKQKIESFLVDEK